MVVAGLVLCELVEPPAFLLHLIGIAVALSRLLHVVGLPADRATTARSLGVLIVWASALTIVGHLARRTWLSFSGHFGRMAALYSLKHETPKGFIPFLRYLPMVMS